MERRLFAKIAKSVKMVSEGLNSVESGLLSTHGPEIVEKVSEGLNSVESISQDN